MSLYVQWNLSIYSGHPWGTNFWPLYSCFVHKLFIWDLDSWPLYRGGLYSGVAINEGFHLCMYGTVSLYIVSTLVATELELLGGAEDDDEGEERLPLTKCYSKVQVSSVEKKIDS